MLKSYSKMKNVHQVAVSRLCVGCGACFSMCPNESIQLVDVEDDGIRPFVDENKCQECRMCLKVCPGVCEKIPKHASDGFQIDFQSRKRWGTFLEIWEGHSADQEIRFKGSSGGLCTALSLFCLEQGAADGILHVGSDPEKPWKNKTFLSTTRDALIGRTGSRYAPAAPSEGIKLIEDSKECAVFIGKPCDVAGLRMLRNLRPELDRKTALMIGFFCAGTPSTKGSIELLKYLGAELSEVSTFRYRGMGWPGMLSVQFKDRSRPNLNASYKASWGFIQKFRPFRCYLCPDLTAEFADISVGDPWYREVDDDELGRSLVLIRTERGRAIFHRAMEQGYVVAEPTEPDKIYLSQKNLLGKRQAIWGRILVLKLLGISRPELTGFHLFENWLDLPLQERIKSIIGTVRRIIKRNYFKPLEFEFKKGSWCTAKKSSGRGLANY